MSTLLDSTTVKVDGTDLAATGVSTAWSGSVFDAIDPAFDTIGYPGADQLDIAEGAAHSSTWTVRHKIVGTDLDDAWAKIRALRRRTKPGKKVQLTRYMPGGESGSLVSLLTYGQRLGDTVAWSDENDHQAVVATDFLLLGFWYPSSSTAIASAAGTQSIDGDIRTRKMTVTLAAGSARTVTNTTNGYWFTYSGSVPSSIVVDIEARTATLVSGSLDVSMYLSWGKTYPMQLEPGTNVLAVSSGAAAIAYYPAYQ